MSGANLECRAQSRRELGVVACRFLRLSPGWCNSRVYRSDCRSLIHSGAQGLIASGALEDNLYAGLIVPSSIRTVRA